MNTILHKANTRGHASHGWLDTHHTFSFADYYDPERMHFGMLRVLNDDTIAGGMGFDTHPHNNMEIITIPLEGALAHKDSMGNASVIRAGEVQVMSAGTGIYHSEFNDSKKEDCSLLQIWVFPDKKQVEPRYDQISIQDLEKENKFFQILSPDREDQGVWIHQHAWFSLGKFIVPTQVNYSLHQKENGVYLFMIEGRATINGQELGSRDGLGVWNTEKFAVEAGKDAYILLMEVPMHP